ncbi:conserved exported hypothetical protein [Desulfamplus magnetovallimortis]|uniref:Uncharacterized protein n=1 Tax=Desulfamplus magnetovallimortis TaxID=1246637 RepID=A0A1W1HAI0_9BACT|nr:hypothetical protein [Desulfamplus magnetovallimortis]SLM29378.1 conserved exported hypothetical protein [Desulfamplus magnetovallimortis]
MSRMRQIIILMSLFSVLSIAQNALCESSYLFESWNEIHDKLSESIDLITEKSNAPESSWVPWKSDQKSIDKEINELVDDALDLLGKTKFTEIKNKINELQQNISKSNKKIAELRTILLGAPKDVAAWKVWKKDTADYEQDIIDLKGKIEADKEEISHLKLKMIEEFKSIGVVLDQEQIDTLVASITSDDDIQLISVFNNIKILTVKLKDLTVESSESPENAKRYYGMHTILLKILIRLHEHYVGRVENEYLPKLDGIIEKNIDLGKKTKNLMSEADEKHKSIYQANFKAQKVTHKTATLYEKYLQDNCARVKEAHAKLIPEYQAALNTYNTVSTAHDLISLMKSANSMFNNLSELQTPKLLIFENKEMKNEFSKITMQMKEGLE